MSHCTINPVVGIAHRLDKLIKPVERHKRVAVVGGGPGGIKCALWLKQRGHEPVLFEKTDALGGQIKTARYPDFKWELCRYLDFLVEQIKRKGIEVRLNTEATPESIAEEGFDVVVAAVGAVPQKPDIPGAEYARFNIVDVYEREPELGKRVVVVGGASGAAEAAVFLARKGHEVTLLSRKNIIGYDLNPIRSRGYMNWLAKKDGVQVIPYAKTVKIEPDCVHYLDKDGQPHCAACDDVLASGGMKALCEQAAAFYGSAPEFFAIGDGQQTGNMRKAIADAFAAAMQI